MRAGHDRRTCNATCRRSRSRNHHIGSGTRRRSTGWDNCTFRACYRRSSCTRCPHPSSCSRWCRRSRRRAWNRICRRRNRRTCAARSRYGPPDTPHWRRTRSSPSRKRCSRSYRMRRCTWVACSRCYSPHRTLARRRTCRRGCRIHCSRSCCTRRYSWAAHNSCRAMCRPSSCTDCPMRTRSSASSRSHRAGRSHIDPCSRARKSWARSRSRRPCRFALRPAGWPDMPC